MAVFLEHDERRTPCSTVFDIRETKGATCIAVSQSTPLNFDGFEDVRASMVDPQADAPTMHFVMLTLR